MASSPPLPAPPPAPGPPRLLWSVTTAARPLGLALAREKGTLLAWDDHHWLYLLNRKGERQGRGGRLLCRRGVGLRRGRRPRGGVVARPGPDAALGALGAGTGPGSGP